MPATANLTTVRASMLEPAERLVALLKEPLETGPSVFTEAQTGALNELGRAVVGVVRRTAAPCSFPAARLRSRKGRSRAPSRW